ncbi:MAG: DUF58 domain-containing protein [Candidatus Rokubacteria bacterium]|nr:DUF58 domain-containing protein [Candidatus Rokubacteria bacterium]
MIGGRWRFLRPRRTIWPTRDGWWGLFAAVGVGFAAINTGNNLLYLLASLLLGLIVVSGVLSEQSMRRLRLVAVLPDEIHAGRPALFGTRITNRKRWLSSYSITVEVLAPAGGRPRSLYLLRLPPGDERLLTWEETLPVRGRHRLPGLRVTTRFPFGLFRKAGRAVLESEVVVYPALRPVSPEMLRLVGGTGPRAVRRRGRGHALYNLREYRPGDDPRLIHWRSSAKASALMVRELEDETAVDTRLVLEGTGRRDPARLEVGLSEAASLAVHLLRSGGTLELVGPGVLVSLGRGRAQERRVLQALALYDPTVPAPARRPAERPLRELRVRLD